jgi:hypothetical protein
VLFSWWYEDPPLCGVQISASAFNRTSPISSAVLEPHAWMLMLGGLFVLAACIGGQRA